MKLPTLCFVPLLLASVGCGNDGATDSPIDLTLKAPTELTVDRIGRTAVRLSWKDPAEREESFSIERKMNKGLFVARIFTTQNVTTAIDSVGLLADSTYSYRVHAIRYSERGEYSNVVSIRLTLPYP